MPRQPLQNYRIHLARFFLLRPVSAVFDHLNLQIGNVWLHGFDVGG